MSNLISPVETLRELPALVSPEKGTALLSWGQRTSREALPISLLLRQEEGDRQLSDVASSSSFRALGPKCFISHVSCPCPGTGQQLLSEKVASKVRDRMIHPEPQCSRRHQRVEERELEFEKGHKGITVLPLCPASPEILDSPPLKWEVEPNISSKLFEDHLADPRSKVTKVGLYKQNLSTQTERLKKVVLLWTQYTVGWGGVLSTCVSSRMCPPLSLLNQLCLLAWVPILVSLSSSQLPWWHWSCTEPQYYWLKI